MPRKKDSDKIHAILDEILKALKDFNEDLKGPLAAWLKRQGIECEEILKKLTEARSKSGELRLLIEDLNDAVDNGKTMKNSRFANKVVSGFLQRTL